MKITKKQFDILVEKTVKQALNEAPKATSENLMAAIAAAQNLTPQEIGSLITQLRKLQTQKSGAGASNVDVKTVVREFYKTHNAFMTGLEYDGLAATSTRPVLSRLKKLEAFDSAMAGQITPLWKELLTQAKALEAAQSNKEASKAWAAVEKLDDDIMQILRPHLK